MVVKLKLMVHSDLMQFENGVILYGGKTNPFIVMCWITFKNGVILYGGMTIFTKP